MTAGPLCSSHPVTAYRPGDGDDGQDDERHHEQAEDDIEGDGHRQHRCRVEGEKGVGSKHSTQATGWANPGSVTSLVHTVPMTAPHGEGPLPPGDRAVLGRLRGDPSRRPRTDPSLAGGLREWLEDGVGAATRELPPGSPPVWIDRWAMSGRPPFDPDAPFNVSWARRAMLAVLFRQLVVTGRIDDPVADAVGAMAVDEGGARVLEGLRGLPPAERAAVRRAVLAGASVMASQWAAIPPAWRPRTRDRIRIPLAGGRVVLATSLDLVLGTPPGGRRTVCTVRLSAGAGSNADRSDRLFDALLETLRSGAPPFRVATYDPTSGELETLDVVDDHLTAAVSQVVGAVAGRCVPARGAERAA